MTIRRLGPDHVMYATEMWGSAYNVDPLRGKPFDETMDYVNNIGWLSADQKYNILEGNARKVFSRAKFD
jgi:4-oxalmesaconate hydratase